MFNIIGSSYIWLKETDSTNSEALQLIKSGDAESGMVILTNNQKKGRGQRGNKWKSKPGENLTMSIIYMPENLPIKYQFYLNMCVALGIHRALFTELGDSLKLKWTNDIYYDLKKVGGILIENSVQQNKINNAILGIGLNVNQQHFHSSLPNPISLNNITGKFYDLQLLAEQICEGITHYLQLFNNGKKEAVRQAYLNHLLWKDVWQNFETIKGIEALKIIDVAPNGLLIAENTSGRVVQFTFGDIKAVL